MILLLQKPLYPTLSTIQQLLCYSTPPNSTIYMTHASLLSSTADIATPPLCSPYWYNNLLRPIWMVTTTPNNTCTTAIRYNATISRFQHTDLLLWYSCTLMTWYYGYNHTPTTIPLWYNNLLCYHTPTNSAISLLRFKRYSNTPIMIIIRLPQSAILCYSYDHNNSPASPQCFW